MSSLEHTQLRDRIPRTFAAFFDRFPQLLAIQRAAIEPLVEGKDALLAAPTAGGKTEAALAPLLQRILDEGGRSVEGPALIYVSPTRALVNDVYRRLTAAIERLGLTLGRKTGDHQSIGKVMPQVLVTTPESLDSMLSRMPQRLLPLQALVLDELHALAGSPRGDQLAALCGRLRKILATRGARLQVAMLSATVERPQDVAEQFGEQAVVANAPGQREMRARVALSPFSKSPLPKLRELVEGRGGKLLVFCNARADVEWAAGELRGKAPFGTQVFAHHGSLSKQVRERVERDFQHARTAVCFCTSTLELGIDIGDVDYAVLYGVPPDLPSLLQRVGRAGRRSEALRFLALARDRGEILRFRHMMHAAREGRLLTDPPHYDPSTALQQAMSLMLQNPSRAVAPAHVLDRLPAWQAEWWSEERLEEALAHAADWFHRVGAGHYEPTERLEKAFDSGVMHANIGGESEVEVLEELTGRVIGTIARPSPGGDGEGVMLGGSKRAVRQRADGSLVGAEGKGQAEARFERRPAPPIPQALATDLVAWLELDPTVLWRVEGGDDTIFVHGLGTVGGSLLHYSAGDRAVNKPGRGVAFGLRLARGHQDWPAHIANAERLRVYARSMLGRLTRQLGFGPYFRYLPEEERERAVLAAVQPAVIARRLLDAEVEEVYDEDMRMRIRHLLAP